MDGTQDFHSRVKLSGDITEDNGAGQVQHNTGRAACSVVPRQKRQQAASLSSWWPDTMSHRRFHRPSGRKMWLLQSKSSASISPLVLREACSYNTQHQHQKLPTSAMAVGPTEVLCLRLLNKIIFSTLATYS